MGFLDGQGGRSQVTGQGRRCILVVVFQTLIYRISPVWLSNYALAVHSEDMSHLYPNTKVS